uniref:CMP/dCMP-type deaminase domain-containing protein n=1 Tax=viral metagenome TaxID=1070528 RepID=A0A6C0KBR8_9ZZZZ
MSERLSWDEYFAKIVDVTAERSSCDRLHVGCLLVKDNRIVSQGYNGFLPGCPHKSVVRNNHEQATVHAEQNALCDCAKRGVSCAESIAYVTHYPCIICARLLLAAGIKEIKYLHDYKNDELVKVFADQLKVPIVKI